MTTKKASELYDVVVVGGGPAGAVCAAFCARAGLNTLVLEKSRFPREKVCGDCLNPAAWPTLDRLGVSKQILASPHARLRHVEFEGLDRNPIQIPIETGARGEIAIRRSVLDEILLGHARESGAEVLEGEATLRVEQAAHWTVHTDNHAFNSRYLVAADGRNSTVARLLGLLPPAVRDRVGIQTHVDIAPGRIPSVSLRLLENGYCGLAGVDETTLNICLVATPSNLPSIRQWAEKEYAIPTDHEWRTIAPLARAAIDPQRDALLLIGDAARVVEPFTGEGIYYAIASGELAANCLVENRLEGFAKKHEALYSGRLGINRLTRWAVTNPRCGTLALRILRTFPSALGYLTTRIVRP